MQKSKSSPKSSERSIKSIQESSIQDGTSNTGASASTDLSSSSPLKRNVSKKATGKKRVSKKAVQGVLGVGDNDRKQGSTSNIKRIQIVSSSASIATTPSKENVKTSSSSSSTSPATFNILKILQIPKQYLIKLLSNSILQKFLSIPLTILFFLIIKKLFLNHDSLETFFTWMERHPNKGMAAYLIIYPFHMLLFLPGTPLVMGAGYIFKIRFGWLWGVSLCSIITLFGSLIGSIMCFLLARYCIRGTVRRWSKKYPMFDPIDAGKFINVSLCVRAYMKPP